MFLCECNVWIDCSFIGRSWDTYTGSNSVIWSDCPKRCKKICSGSPVPTFKRWNYYDNLLDTQPLQFQPTNAQIEALPTDWTAVSSNVGSIGTVMENAFGGARWRR